MYMKSFLQHTNSVKRHKLICLELLENACNILRFSGNMHEHRTSLNWRRSSMVTSSTFFTQSSDSKSDAIHNINILLLNTFI